MDWAPFIDQFLGEVSATVKEYNQDAGNIKDSVLAFLHAVDWTEPWIIGLLCVHAATLILVLATRKNFNFQSFLFFILLGMVLMAEHINEFAGAHWTKFATQPYFDPSGLFISAVFSVPLVFLVLIILVNSLINMTNMMVKVKRAQIVSEKRAAAANDAKSGKKSDSKKSK
mmetsp:Transcript_42126/g.51141  ORF Transcript_42126/g.51141 Transcript_42126/m.51141 type:complete len:171 (+) Transcript_42126:144-656(+)|eukprot:CAMPEP_0197853610 /NCGR_PEP_ID=MMETSP1438-20131217/23053_1 /TAXON_ID=1461541 /ORGANISM="Pterosperma sp., Strain CCMP1384" /LENGTH=170 /DNA_ID=CAMNT_0043468087 /DNA_START=141 /DNA_END=653 /DNA_ORIENTATION=-